MKRMLSVFLVLLMILGSTGCVKEEGEPPEVTDPDPSETAQKEDTKPPEEPPTESGPADTFEGDIKLIENGTANYSIIRNEDATNNIIDLAMSVRRSIRECTGVFPEIGVDRVKFGVGLDHSSLEILVGDTKYEESAEALDGIPYGDYVIKRVGNKLVINALSSVALSAAVSRFEQEVEGAAEEGNLCFPQNICFTDTALPIANVIPVYDGGTPRVVYDTGDGCQMLIIDGTDPGEYSAYCDKLKNEGYTLYAENNIRDNRSAIYINDQYTINIGYYAYETAVRLMIEPRGPLPNLPEENTYTPICGPTISMFGLEFPELSSDTENGMAFALQLSDGSYIVIDGGYNRERDAANLFHFMIDHAPDQNHITIAAWIITHAHGDHAGCFYKFTENYARQIKLERVIGNFPSDETREIGGLGGEGAGSAKVVNYVTRYADAEFVNIHVGNKVYLRDAEIEFLYTPESFAPNVLSYFNTSSVVFKVKIAGQEILFLGDASNDTMEIVTQMYGDYLDCDIIQTAHHGYMTSFADDNYTAVMNGYTLASPGVVLWPVGDIPFSTMHNRPYDAHLMDLDSVKEIFVAGSRDITLSLPYAAGTSEYESILK